MRTESSGSGRERGSILVHVLLTGIVVALIAATLLRMALLRYAMAGRSEKILKEKRDDQGVLAAVTTAWNAVPGPNTTCGAVPPGFTCPGGLTPGTCNCSCTQTATGVTVIAAPGSGVCQLSIVSPDLP
ncbi:MAG: hypothetical protein ACHQ2Z_03050 [Elusimicrobiota bacterium]